MTNEDRTQFVSDRNKTRINSLNTKLINAIFCFVFSSSVSNPYPNLPLAFHFGFNTDVNNFYNLPLYLFV